MGVCCLKQITLRIRGIGKKTHFIMFMGSVGRNLDRTNLEMACLCSTMPGNLPKKPQTTDCDRTEGTRNIGSFLHLIWTCSGMNQRMVSAEASN